MARLCMLLLACMRGNIFIYQGEELGLPQAKIAFEQLRDPEAIANWPLTLGRDGARTPLPWTAKLAAPVTGRAQPWLPVAPEHLPLAVELQERDAGSLLFYTRHVLALRKANEALVSGTMQIVEASADILAFERRTRDQRLLCVFNLGLTPHTWNPLGSDPTHAWHVIERLGAVEDWKLPALSGLVAERTD